MMSTKQMGINTSKQSHRLHWAEHESTSKLTKGIVFDGLVVMVDLEFARVACLRVHGLPFAIFSRLWMLRFDKYKLVILSVSICRSL